MGPFDWIALLFATFVVSQAIVGELKDIELVSLAVRKAGDKLNPITRVALIALGGVRRWLFLPVLLSNVPHLAMVKGGDALSVCFNTIAVIFLLDVDNVTYAILLAERVRTRAEQRTRMELSDGQLTGLARSKDFHVGVMMVLVPLAVWTADHGSSLFYPMWCFLLGGLSEVAFEVMNGASPGASGRAARVCKGVAKVAGQWFVGVVVYMALFQAAVEN